MERFVTIDGRQVRYLESGAGRAIVLLHPFPLSADYFRPQLAAMPQGWRLLAPDLRGFGRTRRQIEDGEQLIAAPARAIDDYASDVVAFMDALDIEDAVVGGVSMGGYVTFGVLRLAPHRVRAVILADTRAEADTEEARRNREAMLARLAEEGPPAVADIMLPKLLGPVARSSRPELEQYVRGLIESNDAASIADAITCLMTRPDSSAVLTAVTVAVQLIAGRDDELTPVACHDRMQACLAHASLSVIEDAGHLASLEQPDVFNRIVSRFLATLS